MAQLEGKLGGASVIPDPLVPSQPPGAAGRTGPMTLAVAQQIAKSSQPSPGDRGKQEKKATAKVPAIKLEPRPASQEVRVLAAVIFAESQTADLGGEIESEKLAIGAVFLNRVHYAKTQYVKGKKCYNQDFGDGTVYGAISHPNGSIAVGKAMWNKIAGKGDLKSQAELEKSLQLPADREHYNLSVKAAVTVAQIQAPILIKPLEKRVPVSFDQSAKGIPSPRMERIGKLGNHHHFYAFKEGRECQ